LTSEPGALPIMAGADSVDAARFDADVAEAAGFNVVPHNCFGCGTLNAGGLGLTMHIEAGRSWTALTLDRRFEGWEGMAHGGILCTILDEVMAWALVGQDDWGVTARMSVDFRRPVPIGLPIRAEGWTTLSRRRIVDTAGRIVDATEGTVLASAEGRYVAASEVRQRELREMYQARVAPAVPGSASTGNGSATPDSVVEGVAR
jgi:acyl-coenzyme A thioesterase PaaI-like protein